MSEQENKQESVEVNNQQTKQHTSDNSANKKETNNEIPSMNDKNNGDESNEKDINKENHKDSKSNENKNPKDEKIEELTNTLQHLQADFENYKKHVEKEKAQFLKFSSASLLEEFLPVLDSFDQAMKHTDKQQDFVQGVKLVQKQLLALLKNQGVTPIECVGKPLDPQLHDVMMREQSDKEEDTVLDELQKGYMMHDKVLRHAKVKVAEK